MAGGPTAPVVGPGGPGSRRVTLRLAEHARRSATVTGRCGGPGAEPDPPRLPALRRDLDRAAGPGRLYEAPRQLRGHHLEEHAVRLDRGRPLPGPDDQGCIGQVVQHQRGQRQAATAASGDGAYVVGQRVRPGHRRGPARPARHPAGERIAVAQRATLQAALAPRLQVTAPRPRTGCVSLYRPAGTGQRREAPCPRPTVGTVDKARYRVGARPAPREHIHVARSGTSTGNKLVIVESPAKAKTIAGTWAATTSSSRRIGHVRDLPQSAADVPAKIKGEPWARLGVDVDHDFTPLYVVSAGQGRPRSRSSRACSRTPTNSSSPPTRTARARPSPGTSSTC